MKLLVWPAVSEIGKLTPLVEKPLPVTLIWETVSVPVPLFLI